MVEMVDYLYDLIFAQSPGTWFIIGLVNAMIHVFIMFCVNHKLDDKIEIIPVMLVFCVLVCAGPIVVALELTLLAILACVLTMRSLAIGVKEILGLNKEKKI